MKDFRKKFERAFRPYLEYNEGYVLDMPFAQVSEILEDILNEPQKIIYSSEWIAKILSGQKTMTIRRTQYPCGVYDVVSESESDTVVCQIEVMKVEKWDTDYWLKQMMKHDPNDPADYYNYSDCDYDGGWDGFGHTPSCQIFPCFAESSGFDSIPDFIRYHRENYAPVKFAHTFELVKGDNHDA